MHILVVEDDAPLAKIVKKSLESGGHTVDVAVDGQEGLDLGRQRSHDAVVLDIQLPKVNGMDVCRKLREDGNAVPIIMLTARGAVADRIDGLDAGADDYLPKPFSPSELVVRVKAILRRTSGASMSGAAMPGATAGQEAGTHGVIRHNGLVLDPARHEVTVDGRPVQLTHVEFRLLRTLLDADGRVLSRDQLLDAVWGEDEAEVLDRTIDVHVRRLRDKLGDDADAPRWVATVRGAGYRSAPVATP